ncbi:hypothetical protein FC62_GL000765 [Amylolactobacillus amylotrophicus DSM 20534]|uniref:Septation inhibitor protein n=2 Tax=Amylolactobacillus TaxID=2767876 RepID=A0A0R1YJ63_9LACO|nr:hypothetical protein FC62_GL000765 [Amylolactobacillus amylotrophicus DSM 20534]KRM42257.1 hypothetical protein FD40_GL001043 [Amylolactobacillus amylophilus DSM 20533 = JCM 1125]
MFIVNTQQNPSGPRIFNQVTEAQQYEILKKKAARREREVHRVRRNRIIGIFSVLILVFVVQIAMVSLRTSKINSQVSASKVQYQKAEQTNKVLKGQVKQLKDETYVGKLIRYKYYYSKPGETIYNLPTRDFELSTQNGE